MTHTLSPEDTGDIELGTRDLSELAYLIRRPSPYRRPDATGEQPIYQPKTIAIVGEIPTRLVGAEELARLSAGETLILPTDATPAPPRHAVPTVYTRPEDGSPPRRYRGTRRAARRQWPLWALATALFGSGVMSGAGLVLAAAYGLAGIR